MDRSEYCILIPTFGRPDSIKTIKTINDCGVMAPIYLLVSEDDDKKRDYIKNYGKNVIVFCKDDIKERLKVDAYDIGDNKKTVLYARNACWEIANKLGFKYYLELDDDYTGFYYRYDENESYITGQNKIKNELEDIFEIYFDFLEESGIHCVAFAQGGDFIGGAKGENYNCHRIRVIRKVMNSFFCKTDRPFEFFGTMNDDVNTYTVHQQRGKVFITPNIIYLNQGATQQNSGGLTDIYIDKGTYVKSAYTFLSGPSYTRFMLMGKHKRIHHNINWTYCAPKIIRQEIKYAS